ncbi:D-alanyl-D-alanine carboxypeptidase family protein [Actinomadura sp. WMMB 499]|uniref:M15 family metallopeptidase n=1 Tax=Actinomadura sp. WMMB 499 TaxID=1219491 RepID=UPI0020C7C02C|nr:M15 family metallopeptidase [Actinomadura sp. WMMB 499]
MIHRHVSKVSAPLAGMALAGIFAGSLALASAGGDGPGGPGAATLSANHAEPTEKSADSGEQDEQDKKDEREDAPPALPADCEPDEAAELEYTNGRIPDEDLCPLPQEDESLRADAAAAFYKLNAAYHERFGEQMCVRSSYRSYERQEELYRSMPSGMAAAPGNSNHGDGLAADLCGGVEEEGTPEFEWLEDNAEEYGWIHPDWAYSNPYEPWHWEFDAGRNG